MFHSTPKPGVNPDVQELRYRIGQLETLVAQSSLGSGSSSLPSDSTLLQSHNGVLSRLNQLEELLAASEHENEVLRKDLELLCLEKNRQEVKLLEKLFKKDSDYKDLEHSHDLVQLQLTKAHAKLSHVQDYINGLPSLEELQEARSTSTKLGEENELLEGNLKRTRENVISLQKEKKILETKLQRAELKLEELKPLEEAQEAFLSSGGEIPSEDFQHIPEHIQELLTLQKAQIIRSSKLLNSFKEKISELESDKADCMIKITNLESDIHSLHEHRIAAQLKMDSLSDQYKSLEEDKKQLETNNEELNRQIQEQDSGLKEKADHIHSLIQLVTEIDLSVHEVEKLVELGQCLALGDQPSVTTLIGFGEDIATHLLQTNEKSHPPPPISQESNNYDSNDPEWTLSRLVRIRKVRKHLRDLRDISSDLYTDIVGGKIENCQVQ